VKLIVLNILHWHTYNWNQSVYLSIINSFTYCFRRKCIST